MAQAPLSIGRALYRMTFRGGTPQRITFDARLMAMAAIATPVLGALCLRMFFGLSYLEVGLALFTVLSGVYIAAALLTRKVPRPRLRQCLQALLLLLATSLLLLLLMTPLALQLEHARLILAVIVLGLLTSGAVNVLHFAQGGPRSNAVLLTVAFVAGLGAFYALLRGLLEAVFGG
ncbi:MAG: hypothetical protein AAGE43_12185 [Pseudomonadota bacterium]